MYKKDILGTWVSGESMYIVTPKYVLLIPNKKMYTNTYMNGEISPYKITPQKYFYVISKESSGAFFIRTNTWYRIYGKDKEISLDNRQFLIRLGTIKFLLLDGGDEYKKISDEETIERLRDYNLDYNIIRKLPIERHQNISKSSKVIYDTEPENTHPKGFKTKVNDNSLPDIVEKFLLKYGI